MKEEKLTLYETHEEYLRYITDLRISNKKDPTLVVLRNLREYTSFYDYSDKQEANQKLIIL